MYFMYSILFLLVQSYLLFGSEVPNSNNSISSPWSQDNNTGQSPMFNSRGNGLGEYGFPSNPMNDRAVGYLLKGKAKTAVTNYGEFIEWDVHPAGLWGDYTYLPDVCFIAGIPGQSYSYRYEWFNSDDLENNCPEYIGEGVEDITLWCSKDAYRDQLGTEPGFSWYELGDTNFVGVVFESYLDVNAIIGEEKYCPGYGTDNNGDLLCSQLGFNPTDDQIDSLAITGVSEWFLDHDNDMLIISLPSDGSFNVNPNLSNVYGNPNVKKTVGLVYPWAMRPALSQRLDDFDLYDYGNDNIPWTVDDIYAYYGSNVAESWFTRWNPSSNTDWQPSHDLSLD